MMTLCMNLESFIIFLRTAQLETMLEKINDKVFVIHAITGDVYWFLSDTHACTGGLIS